MGRERRRTSGPVTAGSCGTRCTVWCASNVRQERWTSSAVDGFDAQPHEGSVGTVPCRRRAASGGRGPCRGAHEPESADAIRTIGGGPTNDVPRAYLDRISELLDSFAGPEGQEWWLAAGIKELRVTYDLDAGEATESVRRLHGDVLSADDPAERRPGSTCVPDPRADRRAGRREPGRRAVRKRTGSTAPLSGAPVIPVPMGTHHRCDHGQDIADMPWEPLALSRG